MINLLHSKPGSTRGVIVKFNKPRSRNGRALLDGLYCAVANIQEGVDSPRH